MWAIESGVVCSSVRACMHQGESLLVLRRATLTGLRRTCVHPIFECLGLWAADEVSQVPALICGQLRAGWSAHQFEDVCIKESLLVLRRATLTGLRRTCAPRARRRPAAAWPWPCRCGHQSTLCPGALTRGLRAPGMRDQLCMVGGQCLRIRQGTLCCVLSRRTCMRSSFILAGMLSAFSSLGMLSETYTN